MQAAAVTTSTPTHLATHRPFPPLFPTSTSASTSLWGPLSVALSAGGAQKMHFVAWKKVFLPPVPFLSRERGRKSKTQKQNGRQDEKKKRGKKENQ